MEGAGVLPSITLEGTLFCSRRFLTLVLYPFFCLCLFLHCPSPFLSFFLSVFPWSSLCFPPSWSLFVSASLPPTRSPLFPCSFFLTVPWLSWWTCWRRRWSQGAPGTLCAQQCTGHLARGAMHGHCLLYQSQKRSEGQALGQQPGFHTRPTGGVHSEGTGTEALRLKAIWLLL